LTVTVRRHERGLGLVLSETHKVERIEEWSDAHGTLRAGDQPLAILHRTLALAVALAVAVALALALALTLARLNFGHLQGDACYAEAHPD